MTVLLWDSTGPLRPQRAALRISRAARGMPPALGGYNCCATLKTQQIAPPYPTQPTSCSPTKTQSPEPS